jgi:nucleotide-binding universal stress UspA family protein
MALDASRPWTVAVLVGGAAVRAAGGPAAVRHLVSRHRLAGARALWGRIVRAEPGQALVELSRDAALLGVGTEHKGIMKRVVIGSTSAYCSRRSRVPVVVVPYVDQELYGSDD